MVSLDVVVPYAGDNDSGLMAIEWRLTLEKLLPIRDWQWMWQHYVGGESLATIGNREHVTLATVKMRLFRARRRLRQTML
jgi:DNA-directed RNA polymerase specialized sigma24 family protein